MASSKSPHPLGWLVDFVSNLIPARTPGPMGVNDAGDPNRFTCLGDLVGPLGADPLYNADLQFALCMAGPHEEWRAEVAAAPKLDLATAKELSLRITSHFETGRAMNYGEPADDHDQQATSFGILQWNFGQGTLGPLLKLMLDRDANAFAAAFGPTADYETLKAALIAGDKAKQAAWARALLKSDRAAWKAAFKALGKVQVFNAIQVSEALKKYYPMTTSKIAWLREIAPDLMKGVEFRSYAALFDLSVQQGRINEAAQKKIIARVEAETPVTQLDLLKITVTERAKTALERWVADCLSRRLGILAGGTHEATAHENTAKRVNPELALIGTHGASIVEGL